MMLVPGLANTAVQHLQRILKHFILTAFEFRFCSSVRTEQMAMSEYPYMRGSFQFCEWLSSKWVTQHRSGWTSIGQLY